MPDATTYRRTAVAAALGTALLLVWAIGALGVIGSGGPPDLMYVGVLLVAAAGTVLARLRPHGMATAMLATAAALVVVTVVALAAGLQDHEGASVADILAVNGMFAALFCVSAWLFRRAAKP